MLKFDIDTQEIYLACDACGERLSAADARAVRRTDITSDVLVIHEGCFETKSRDLFTDTEVAAAVAGTKQSVPFVMFSLVHFECELVEKFRGTAAAWGSDRGSNGVTERPFSKN